MVSMLCCQAFKQNGKWDVANHILNYRKKKPLISEMRCEKKELSSDIALIQGIRESPQNFIQYFWF